VLIVGALGWVVVVAAGWGALVVVPAGFGGWAVCPTGGPALIATLWWLVVLVLALLGARGAGTLFVLRKLFVLALPVLLLPLVLLGFARLFLRNLGVVLPERWVFKCPSAFAFYPFKQEKRRFTKPDLEGKYKYK